MTKKQILIGICFAVLAVLYYISRMRQSEGFTTNPDKRFEGYSNLQKKMVCDQLKSQIQDYQNMLQKPAGNEAEMQAQGGYKEAIAKLETAVKENGC